MYISEQTKKRIEIIFALTVIIALILLLFTLLTRDKKEDVIDYQDLTQLEDVFTSDEMNNPEIRPEVTARSFVERFGSFSTESNFGNVDDVFPLVTPELRLELEDLRKDAAGDFGSDYYGVSTQVIQISLLSETDTEAILTLTTQKEESFGHPGNTEIRYQEIDVTLNKIGDNWLISSYNWK